MSIFGAFLALVGLTLCAQSPEDIWVGIGLCAVGGVLMHVGERKPKRDIWWDL